MKICSFLCISSFLLCFLIISPIKAGEIRESFDSPNLDPNLWKIASTGKATHKVDNGKLILTSDAVSDGICFYYVKKIMDEDITIEVIADPSGIKDAGVIGFTDQIIPPTLNTDINPHFRDSFMGVKPIGCYLFDDAGNAHLDMKSDYKPEQHTFRIELSKDKVIFSIDGKETGILNREASERYFVISPDPYTSHYAGSITVDSIRLIGLSLAVRPEAKSTITWGAIKKFVRGNQNGVEK